ncbi:hypothetical protein BDF19DRAFT_417438 [Syncephalis fuscata]|nr:hypothetical protein BDF19DRAFT_417438 [Syncephalis fuscata]
MQFRSISTSLACLAMVGGLKSVDGHVVPGNSTRYVVERQPCGLINEVYYRCRIDLACQRFTDDSPAICVVPVVQAGAVCDNFVNKCMNFLTCQIAPSATTGVCVDTQTVQSATNSANAETSNIDTKTSSTSTEIDSADSSADDILLPHKLLIFIQ